VHHARPDEVGETVARIAAQEEARTLAIPVDLPREWRPSGAGAPAAALELREDGSGGGGGDGGGGDDGGAGDGGGGGMAGQIREGGALSLQQLDQVDGALTGCAVAIAEVGAFVLDAGPGQGRRALTLVPDLHICVVRENQVVGIVPEAIGQLEPAVRAGRPLTFVAGPSATSDIELDRVEGVHGPRRLHVVLVAD
jgi:L-lactate dehydrogenase complex protein LldG